MIKALTIPMDAVGPSNLTAAFQLAGTAPSAGPLPPTSPINNLEKRSGNFFYGKIRSDRKVFL
jgi:hypothetical protein